MNARAQTALHIFEREYTRLFQWALGSVDDWSAHQVAYIAFSTLLWSGVSGRHTSKGTVAGLYMAAEPPLRRAVEIRGGYLAAGAWKRAPWPIIEHGIELAALYAAWVYVHSAAGMGWPERSYLVDGLRFYRPGMWIMPTGSRMAAEDARIEHSLRLVAEYLDEAREQVPRGAALAREVWQRERYRTVAAYVSRGTLTGRAANGEDQQDHDPRNTRQTDRVNHLVSLWAVRDAQPVPGIRYHPEPTDYQ